jgi:trehalose 2-sulfotransferase
MWAERWQLDRRANGAVDYEAFLSAAIKAGSSANGVFAARTMWGTVDAVVARLRGLRPEVAGSDHEVLTAWLGPTRYVHLTRNDVVAQAVSWVRAEQTEIWQPGDTSATGTAPRFDFDRIDACIETIHDHNRAWAEWFAANEVVPHPVGYEDLVVDMVGVTGGILRFLGLDPGASRNVEPRVHRQADEINREWIDRYRALTRPAPA